MSNHLNTLRRERDALRSRRVQLRRAIEFRAGAFGGDPIDARNAQEFCLRELRSSQARFDELNFLLGEEPGPVVRVDRAAVARANAAVSRRLASSYIKKVIR